MNMMHTDFCSALKMTMNLLHIANSIRHQLIPVVPIPPGQPLGITNYFQRNGKFPRVGTNKLVKCPGVRAK